MPFDEGGNDVMFGGLGDDFMHAGPGNDAMSGKLAYLVNRTLCTRYRKPAKNVCRFNDPTPTTVTSWTVFWRTKRR